MTLPQMDFTFTMDVDEIPKTKDSTNVIVNPSQRIPPEIVVKIIRLLLPTNIGHGSLILERLDALIKVTSISRYWRYAAFDHATLWSIVPIDRRSLGERFLQRSRNAPLLVTYEVNTRRCCPAHYAMVSLLPHIQRVKKVQLRATAPVLNQIFSGLNTYSRKAQLEEIRIQVEGSPNDEQSRVALELLLENASTLKVLHLDVFKCRFPVHRIREFSGLTHLELLSTHHFSDVSPLLTSLPTLASLKVGVSISNKRKDGHRIVPQASLRHIHLRIDQNPGFVLDALGVPVGVHLDCEITDDVSTIGANQFLPLSSEAFENTSHTQELCISLPLYHPNSRTSYSGSGPAGSFSISGVFELGYQQPIEDFSHLRKLVVDGSIERRSLEEVVMSAPHLVSVTLADCLVTRCPVDFRGVGTTLSPVNADGFVTAMREERRMGGGGVGSLGYILVNGTLDGDPLKEFRTLIENCDQIENRIAL